MADDSPCFFHRLNSKITVHPDDFWLPESGRKILHLELTSDEWSVLSTGEFFSRLFKSKFLGAEFVEIYGDNPSNHLKFLSSILPMIRPILPIRMCVNWIDVSFMEQMIGQVDGLCIEINVPLDQADMKSFLSRHVDRIKRLIDICDNFPLTLYKVPEPEVFDPESIFDLVGFFDEYKAPMMFKAMA